MNRVLRQLLSDLPTFSAAGGLHESLAGHPLRLWQRHGPQTNCPAARWQAGELTAKPIFTKL